MASGRHRHRAVIRGVLGLLLAVSAGACSSPAPEPPASAPIATPSPATPDVQGAPATRPPDSSSGDARAGARASRDAGVSRWTVDLERDEQRGGHTIARHVGRTDAQLRARLAREGIAAASTYPDLETAERIVAQALAENERRVGRWIDRRGPRSNLAIRYRARAGLPTGRMLRRGDDAPQDVTGAVVVLRWRDDAFYVLTSYPEEPR